MKIAHIALSGTFTEDFNYHENELSFAQKTISNNDVFVISRNSKRINNEIVFCDPEYKVMSNGVRLYRISMKYSKYNTLTKPKNCKDVLKILQKEKPDLIWVHGLMNNSLSIVCKYKKHNNVVVFADSHVDLNNYNMTVFGKAALLFFNLRNKMINKYVDMFYGVTPGRVSFMRRFLGVPDNKTKLSFMGANSSLINFESANEIKNKLRKELSIPSEAFVYVTGGKIDDNKKTIDLIKAFTDCSNDNLYLLIFGSVDDKLSHTFNEITKKDKRIIYVGWKSSIECNNLFLASDCAIFLHSHSTLWENSLACGLVSVFGQKEGLDHLFYSHGYALAVTEGQELTAFLESFPTSNKYKELLKKSIVGKNLYFYENIALHIENDYLLVKGDNL